MRIVFYNHTGLVSGAEKMLLLSIANLPRDVAEVILVCPEEGSLQSEAIALGIPTYTCRPILARFTYNPVLLIVYLWSIVRALYEVRNTFISLSPDILQANTVRAGIVASLATMGTRMRIIWHSHDILPAHALTTLVRLLAHSSRRIQVVACSKAAAYSLRPFTSKGVSVNVIHNGIEAAKFRGKPDVRKAKREEMGLRPASFAVGIIGQVTRRKGHLGLIRAFADLQSAIPEAVLLIIGAPIFHKDHEYLSVLEQEVAALQLGEKVRFLGQRPDIPALMQALDLIVLNSDVEPFALVLIEAMMTGKPVIATDCGGPPEIIHHGVDGEIVAVGDRPALVSAMIRLARNPGLRERYGKAAICCVELKFSSEQYISKWCDQYRRIITSTHPTSGSTEVASENLEMQAGVRK